MKLPKTRMTEEKPIDGESGCYIQELFYHAEQIDKLGRLDRFEAQTIKVLAITLLCWFEDVDVMEDRIKVCEKDKEERVLDAYAQRYIDELLIYLLQIKKAGKICRAEARAIEKVTERLEMWFDTEPEKEYTQGELEL